MATPINKTYGGKSDMNYPGKTFNCTKIFEGMGNYQGDPCDLYQYTDENGQKRLVESVHLCIK